MCSYKKFHNSIINVPSLGQTGFFLTDSVVVTCAHGAKENDLEIGSNLEIITCGKSICVTVDFIDFVIVLLISDLDRSINLSLCVAT